MKIIPQCTAVGASKKKVKSWLKHELQVGQSYSENMSKVSQSRLNHLKGDWSSCDVFRHDQEWECISKMTKWKWDSSNIFAMWLVTPAIFISYCSYLYTEHLWQAITYCKLSRKEKLQLLKGSWLGSLFLVR